jgi:hypothetical protein
MNEVLPTQEDTIASTILKEGPSSRELDFPDAPDEEKQNPSAPSPEEGTHSKEIEPQQNGEVQ